MTSPDPWVEAVFPVAWAEESISLNWFHTAREFTEKWHHQQQIREAMGDKAILMERQLFHPFIATMLMALPHHYRNIEARPGTSLRVEISGEAGGQWTLSRLAEIQSTMYGDIRLAKPVLTMLSVMA